MRKNDFSKLFLALLLFCGLISGERAAAQPVASVPESSLSFHEKIEQWEKLKEENPELFQKAGEARIEAIKERIKTLQKNNKEKFEELRGLFKTQRRDYFEKLKEESPAQFKSWMRQRFDQFENRRQRHPESFEIILNRRPDFKRKWERLSQEYKQEKTSFTNITPRKGGKPRIVRIFGKYGSITLEDYLKRHPDVHARIVERRENQKKAYESRGVPVDVDRFPVPVLDDKVKEQNVRFRREQAEKSIAERNDALPEDEAD